MSDAEQADVATPVAAKLPSPPKKSLCNSCSFYDAEHSCWRLRQLKDSHQGAMPFVRDCPDYAKKAKE